MNFTFSYVYAYTGENVKSTFTTYSARQHRGCSEWAHAPAFSTHFHSDIIEHLEITLIIIGLILIIS